MTDPIRAQPANQVQVGGDHYRRSAIQHWDFAAEMHLGYFEGQVTKYVTRHAKKKGREDLEKALHFTHKLLELFLAGVLRPMHKWCLEARLTEYVEANGLGPAEHIILREVLRWSNKRDLTYAAERIEALIAEAYPSC